MYELGALATLLAVAWAVIGALYIAEYIASRIDKR